MLENYIKEKSKIQVNQLMKRVSLSFFLYISICFMLRTYFPEVEQAFLIIGLFLFFIYLSTNKYATFNIQQAVISSCIEKKGFIQKEVDVLEKNSIEYKVKFLDEKPVLINGNNYYEIDSFH